VCVCVCVRSCLDDVDDLPVGFFALIFSQPPNDDAQGWWWECTLKGRIWLSIFKPQSLFINPLTYLLVLYFPSAINRSLGLRTLHITKRELDFSVMHAVLLWLYIPKLLIELLIAEIDDAHKNSPCVLSYERYRRWTQLCGSSAFIDRFAARSSHISL
jgi:hypothetical protein